VNPDHRTESTPKIQKVVIHVDLDGGKNIFAHHGLDHPWDDDTIYVSGMTHLLEFLEHNQLTATLFVVAEDLDDPSKKALLERAVAAGHEIASHSHTHAELDDLDPKARRREVFESKRRLEQELGVEVKGFRAPSYQIDRELFEMLGEAGYRWDSSAFATPAFSRRLRVPSVLQVPAKPLLDTDVFEIPLPAHKPAPFPFHPCYSLLLGYRYFSRCLRRFERCGAPLVLLFHLTDFADPLPRERRKGWKGRLYTLSTMSAARKRLRCQRILDRVLESFVVTTTSELLDAHRAPATKLVLGISTTHETGAALFDGHECLAAVSEERLDRVKFSTKYPPKKSIESVIETAGVDPSEITDVVVSGLPAGKLFKRLVRSQLEDTFDYHGLIDYFPHFNKLLYRVFAYKRVLAFLARRYGIEPRIHFVPHHLCHAASAYRTAPFDDALIVTADGVGDAMSVSISTGEGGCIELLHSIPYPHSFGQFYTACTQVLGFRANRHEGKITGLSGFGTVDPELYALVKHTIRSSGPDFKLDKRYYSEGIIRGLSLRMLKRGEDLFEVLQYRNYKRPLATLLAGWKREDVAAVFQTLLEEELIKLVQPFADRTGKRNLCLAGGIFANVKANAALFRALGFDNVYIYPNMGDGGLGPGAALEFLQARPEPFDRVYWGPEYTDDEIKTALESFAEQGLEFERCDDIEYTVAHLLAEDRVVARFNGRMEFGPRALCNRSILYGAGDPKANDWLNKRLGRTEFMPFAPVALEDRAELLFEDVEGAEHACKFMTIILDCTDFTKQRCPAVVHVDGTARPQLVNSDINPSMTAILRHYEQLTGIPLLVNTSFNMHEEPIVCSPDDACRAFVASKLDYLAIGPFLAWLPETENPTATHTETKSVSAVN